MTDGDHRGEGAWWVPLSLIVALAVSFALGVVLGTGDDANQPVVPGPTVTVTETVQPEPEKRKKKRPKQTPSPPMPGD